MCQATVQTQHAVWRWNLEGEQSSRQQSMQKYTHGKDTAAGMMRRALQGVVRYVRLLQRGFSSLSVLKAHAFRHPALNTHKKRYTLAKVMDCECTYGIG